MKLITSPEFLQGSSLGPVLSNLSINDIHECFAYYRFLLFADDLKLCYRVSSVEDCDKIQCDLINLIGVLEMALH